MKPWIIKDDVKQEFYWPERGQVLAEILVAVMLAGIIIGGIAATIGTSVITGNKVRETTVAVGLIQDAMEGIKAISESSWVSFYCLPNGICPGSKGSDNHFYPDYVDGSWQIVSGEKLKIVEGVDYTYYFYVENVNRDSSGNITTTGGTEDPSTQKITIVVNWPPNNSVVMSEYRTRVTSNYFADYNWDVGRISSGVFVKSAGYYASTNGPISIINGTITLSTSTDGFLTSPVFDTTFAEGVAFNGIRWKGALPTGAHVRFQLATSNTSTPATWNFIGPDGTTSSYYEAGMDQIASITLNNHNNQRYFRYIVYLYPEPGGAVPVVSKVIITYSP
ncbi:MAG TPA: hypothetical protein PLR11_00955 [Candidatus Paceibacterota bacterium]|nr:hypothetical protein [Candidatus Paceibacterota bacterium]